MSKNFYLSLGAIVLSGVVAAILGTKHPSWWAPLAGGAIVGVVAALVGIDYGAAFSEWWHAVTEPRRQ